MSQQKHYYFDNNATTRVAPEVIESMLPFLHEMWGNASSAYQFGQQVKKHLDDARAKLAALNRYMQEFSSNQGSRSWVRRRLAGS